MTGKQLRDVAWYGAFLLLCLATFVVRLVQHSNWAVLDAFLVVVNARWLAQCFARQGTKL